jgi:acyl-coenzyme A synthetase/AMP-(fatty) acid ligase
MGALVVADVVLNTGVVLNTDVVLKNEAAAEDGTAGMLRGEILQLCREALPRHKVPAAIRFVPSLAVAATGKLERSDG